MNLHQYPFSPSRVTLPDGNRLSVVDEGRGPALVMLHGNPSWSYLYRNLIRDQSGRCRCLAPDHLGCGLSDKPQTYPYRLASHIGNLEFVLDHLRVERCVLVVHDWGGAIGMGWAGRHPDRVAGMVVMNTAAFPASRIPLRIAVCRWPLLGPLLVRGLNGFARAALFMAVTKRLDPRVAAGFLHPYDSWAARVGINGFVRDIPLRPNHPSWPTLAEVEKGLARLRETPMLLCWGGADFCFTRWFFDQWVRRFPGAETLWLEEAGHYLLEDGYEQACGAIRAFLDHRIGWGRG